MEDGLTQQQIKENHDTKEKLILKYHKFLYKNSDDPYVHERNSKYFNPSRCKT